MSETTMTSENWFGHIFDAVQGAAKWAFSGIKTLGDDWAAIKADPNYGPLVGVAVSFATKALQAQGVPVGALVTLGGAVESTLDALAAAHPDIRTGGV